MTNDYLVFRSSLCQFWTGQVQIKIMNKHGFDNHMNKPEKHGYWPSQINIFPKERNSLLYTTYISHHSVIVTYFQSCQTVRHSCRVIQSP